MCMFCRSLFVLCHFSLAIVLSVLLRYTDSDYSFGIFKLFISGQCILHHQRSFDSMSDSSLLLFVLYRVHVLLMLAVFIYAYWCAARFPYQLYRLTITRLVSLVEQKLITFPDQLSSPSHINGVRVS